MALFGATQSSRLLYLNRDAVDSVTGIFAKVSRKPTNQSKFTSKCGQARCAGCHIHPPSKSKEKAKGTMKLRSIGSDSGLIGFPTGISATDLLARLASDQSYDDGDEYDVAIDDYDYDDDDCNVELGIELASVLTEEKIGGENGFEDEIMSYCVVGLCLEDAGDASCTPHDVFANMTLA